MSPATQMAVEEYLRLTDKPHSEYRNGTVTAKTMPTILHGWVIHLLINLLRRQGVQALSEITVRISPTKFLIPDAIVFRDVESPYPTKPVELCCEVLSPDDRLGSMFNKCEEYHAWGVPYCWVIDPEKQAAWEYHRGGKHVLVPHTLRAGNLSVDLRDLFVKIAADS